MNNSIMVLLSTTLSSYLLTVHTLVSIDLIVYSLTLDPKSGGRGSVAHARLVA